VVLYKFPCKLYAYHDVVLIFVYFKSRVADMWLYYVFTRESNKVQIWINEANKISVGSFIFIFLCTLLNYYWPYCMYSRRLQSTRLWSVWVLRWVWRSWRTDSSSHRRLSSEISEAFLISSYMLWVWCNASNFFKHPFFRLSRLR